MGCRPTTAQARLLPDTLCHCLSPEKYTLPSASTDTPPRYLKAVEVAMPTSTPPPDVPVMPAKTRIHVPASGLQPLPSHQRPAVHPHAAPVRGAGLSKQLPSAYGILAGKHGLPAQRPITAVQHWVTSCGQLQHKTTPIVVLYCLL